MKAVTMMRKAIKDSNLNGYTWKATKEGLAWEYCNVFFKFAVHTEGENAYVEFQSTEGVRTTTFLVPETDAWLCEDNKDFHTDIDSAIYWAARRIIDIANHVY